MKPEKEVSAVFVGMEAELVSKRLKEYLESGWTPVICVGDTAYFQRTQMNPQVTQNTCERCGGEIFVNGSGVEFWVGDGSLLGTHRVCLKCATKEDKNHENPN